jgi:hypothetical protein
MPELLNSTNREHASASLAIVRDGIKVVVRRGQDATSGNPQGRSMSPSRPFILRPVATSLLMAAILLVGLVAYIHRALPRPRTRVPQAGTEPAVHPPSFPRSTAPALSWRFILSQRTYSRSDSSFCAPQGRGQHAKTRHH